MIPAGALDLRGDGDDQDTTNGTHQASLLIGARHRLAALCLARDRVCDGAPPPGGPGDLRYALSRARAGARRPGGGGPVGRGQSRRALRGRGPGGAEWCPGGGRDPGVSSRSHSCRASPEGVWLPATTCSPSHRRTCPCSCPPAPCRSPTGNIALRHQLMVLQRSLPRPRPRRQDRVGRGFGEGQPPDRRHAVAPARRDRGALRNLPGWPPSRQSDRETNTQARKVDQLFRPA